MVQAPMDWLNYFLLLKPADFPVAVRNLFWVYTGELEIQARILEAVWTAEELMKL